MNTAENVGTTTRIRVEERVDEFLEELADKGNFVCRKFTRQKMDEKFINAEIAREIFRAHGFLTKVSSEYSTGLLWWAKHYPETWEICFPTANDELDF